MELKSVVRSYRGKIGCACGCRGRYTEKQAIMRRDVAEFLTLVGMEGAKVMEDAVGDWIAVDVPSLNRSMTLYHV